MSEGLTPEALSWSSWSVVVHSVSPEIKEKSFREKFLLFLHGGTLSADAASVLLKLCGEHPGGWKSGDGRQVLICVAPVHSPNDHKKVLLGLSGRGWSEVGLLGPLGRSAPKICKRRIQEGPSGLFTLGVSQE